MRKFIFIILIFGIFGVFWLLASREAYAACAAPYTDYSYTDMAGKDWCCKTGIGAVCDMGETPYDSYCCIEDTGLGPIIPAPGPGPGGWWLTHVWLIVEQYNVMVGQQLSGSLRIETKQDISSPYVFFGDGKTEFFSECDGSDLADDPEKDPLICEYPFTHTYDKAGTFTISGGYMGISSLLDAEETVTVVEVPAPPPGSQAWNPLKATTPEEVIQAITNLVFYVISGLAVLLIILGGYFILTAAGNPEQVTRGRKIILYTIIGYAIMAIARGVVALIYNILGVNATP